ncbi:MAG: GDSL-type esterase/lipase family protein [Microcella pacifica]|jgi:lysophospholipase L1-like esterase|uniref:SGNH/GDSL hydrolase family protein n=1 Tax=Microcella pacifica TaxID=2591847 RepID=A0A9E5MIA9_9MICO|nr:GDSL-type esterase/lipase family protein [Microcella pacifica]NHF62538.1 SGNH/GDSL hydrolase family protein [Microcella pacifica]
MARWGNYRALGDSVSMMRRDASDLTFDSPTWSWTDRVALAVESVARLRGEAAQGCSLASPGATVEQLVHDQVPRALEAGADLVTILIGTSELLDGSARPASLARRLESGVRTLTAAGVDVVLATCLNPPTAIVPRRRRVRTAEFTAELWSIARTHDASVVDAWSLRDARLRPLGTGDRVHLGEEGHRQLGTRAVHVLGLPFVELGGRPRASAAGG